MNKPAPRQMTPAEQNAIARRMILDRGVIMRQRLDARALSGTVQNQVINFLPRNVGLIKKFYVRVQFTLAQAAAETFTRTPFGPANIFSQIVVTDFNNNTRINTSGWHLHQLATVKNGGNFGAAFTNDGPVSNGSAFGVIAAPASVTTAQNVSMFYEIPLCYSDTDLTGIVPGNVVSSTMQLQLTVNPSLIAASGANSNLSVYSSSTASLGTITNFRVTVWQEYIDQVPQDNAGNYILPIIDVSRMYMLNNTAISGLAANQENSISYTNFRDFLSTMVIYDNNGVLNAGTDINTFRIQAANAVDIIQSDPFIQSLLTRKMIGNDFPIGSYYFDHRTRPISTNTYGNMSLLVNPATVSAAASQLLVGFEAFANIGTVTAAVSLPT